MSIGNKFTAEPNFIEQVYLAVERANPNDPTTEIWDDEAIEQLASYLAINGFNEPVEEGLIDDPIIEQIYFLYDMIKWTMGNKSTEAEQDGWTIKTVTDRVCLNCLAGAAGDEPLYGTTINETDQLILIHNVELIERNECNYVEDHK